MHQGLKIKLLIFIGRMRNVIARFRQRIQNFNDSQEADAFLASLDASALLKSQVQQDGENADGDQFEDYSPTYKKTREKQGLQVGIVDYTVTGGFWGSVGPRLRSNDNEGRAIIDIGTSKPEMEVRLKGWKSSRGDEVLRISGEIRRTVLLGYYQRRINKLVSGN